MLHVHDAPGTRVCCVPLRYGVVVLLIARHHAPALIRGGARPETAYVAAATINMAVLGLLTPNT